MRISGQSFKFKIKWWNLLTIEKREDINSYLSQIAYIAGVTSTLR